MSGITKPVLSSEAVEALAARIATAVVVGLCESGIVGITQQPKAEAPARRSATRSATPKPAPKAAASKTRTTSKTRSAKPVSAAQHSRGSVIEVVFGIRADGTLTEAQQSRARQFFASHDVAFGPQPITMRSIVQGIQSVNAALRGENSSTVRYWAVWNGPKGVGRLTDQQARQLLRSSRA